MRLGFRLAEATLEYSEIFTNDGAAVAMWPGYVQISRDPALIKAIRLLAVLAVASLFYVHGGEVRGIADILAWDAEDTLYWSGILALLIFGYNLVRNG